MIRINLILARIEVDFVAQIYYGKDVTVKPVLKIGNSSFVVWHEAWQNDTLAARERRCRCISITKPRLPKKIRSLPCKAGTAF